MVRIIIDKTGVMVDDAILRALAAKCERVGMVVRSTLNLADRAIIILSENLSSYDVVQKLNCASKAVLCRACTTIYIRGMLPPADEVPFRCMCGMWVGVHKKPNPFKDIILRPS